MKQVPTTHTERAPEDADRTPEAWVISDLQPNGVRYLEVGSYAASFYGRTDAPFEWVILVEFTPQNAAGIGRALPPYERLSDEKSGQLRKPDQCVRLERMAIRFLTCQATEFRALDARASDVTVGGTICRVPALSDLQTFWSNTRDAHLRETAQDWLRASNANA
jgi:hypothetical protein